MAAVLPRILDDDEAHDIMVSALGALLAATPDQTFVVPHDRLPPGTRVLVEILANGTTRFSLHDGLAQ